MHLTRMTQVAGIAVAAIASIALFSPMLAKATIYGSQAPINRSSVGGDLALSSLTSLDPCRVSDGHFQSTDAGCQDTATGLIWSGGAEEGGLGLYPTLTEVGWTWWDNYVLSSTFGGHRWRLPTKAELLTLASHDTAEGHLMTHVNVIGDNYVQASDKYRSVHWTVRLGDGASLGVNLIGEGLAVRVN